MKQFELILGDTFVIARIFAVFNVIVYGLLTLLSASLLYITYFVYARCLYTCIVYKKIRKIHICCNRHQLENMDKSVLVWLP